MQKSSVKKLFKDRATSFALFEIVRKYIESLGSVTMSVTKTQIAFRTKRQFAWVWMPQTWIKKVPQNGVVVSFSLDRRVKDKRIKESLESYPGRFMHHVVIEKPSQLDTEVKKWLHDAYAFSQKREGVV